MDGYLQDGVMILSSTFRYRKKYITTVLYKPIWDERRQKVPPAALRRIYFANVFLVPIFL